MTHSLSSPWMCAAVLLLCSARSAATELCVETADSRTELGLSGEEPFHTTESEVTDARLVFVPGSDVVLVLWNEVASGHEAVPFYAISLDGQEIRRVRRTSYELQLSYAHFDPLDGAPEIDARLTADSSNELYVVQFVTQPLAGLRDGLASAGAHVYHFVPNHAYVVRMNSDIRTQVEALP